MGRRYNEGVKIALATRQAEVVEMYQPMTDLMRQCQDSITECMEALLIELKRDHSLVRVPYCRLTLLTILPESGP
jgi:DNA excision repair protein ERCC-4